MKRLTLTLTLISALAIAKPCYALDLNIGKAAGDLRGFVGSGIAAARSYVSPVTNIANNQFGRVQGAYNSLVNNPLPTIIGGLHGLATQPVTTITGSSFNSIVNSPTMQGVANSVKINLVNPAKSFAVSIPVIGDGLKASYSAGAMARGALGTGLNSVKLNVVAPAASALNFGPKVPSLRDTSRPAANQTVLEEMMTPLNGIGSKFSGVLKGVGAVMANPLGSSLNTNAMSTTLKGSNLARTSVPGRGYLPATINPMQRPNIVNPISGARNFVNGF